MKTKYQLGSSAIKLSKDLENEVLRVQNTSRQQRSLFLKDSERLSNFGERVWFVHGYIRNKNLARRASIHSKQWGEANELEERDQRTTTS